MAIASSQGQRIYTLNAANQASHATILAGVQTRQEIKDEIANALAAGKEATIHAAEINVNGWTGSGYLIIDPSTGVGAYKIGGGVNGGFVITGLGIGLISGTAAIVAGPLVAGLVGAIGLLVGVAYALTLDPATLLAFVGARLIGAMAGIILSAILGGYVLVSFSPLFVIGFLYLMLSVVRLLIVDLYTALAEATGAIRKKISLA